MGEGMRVRGIVGVDEDVAFVERGGVGEDGRFVRGELGEEEGGLFAARELNRVDSGAGGEGRAVSTWWGGGPGEEGVEKGRFAGIGGAEDKGLKDVSRERWESTTAGGGAGRAFARFSHCEG